MIGAKDGVTAGMVFAIERVVEGVRDSDTNEVIVEAGLLPGNVR